MQRDIVSGRLICSKEEAATLAAVQLRLEAWPEEDLDLAEGKFHLIIKIKLSLYPFFFFVSGAKL